MVTEVKHKLIVSDGRYVQLPVGLSGIPDLALGNAATPNIFQQDVSQLYPLGTRFVNGERIYHYFKASGTINRMGISLVSNVAMLDETVNTYGASVAGATTIKVDGASAGSPVKDAYAGGYIFLIGTTYYERVLMQIVSNKAAEAAAPYAVELTLDQALPFAVANDVDVNIFPNRYSSCRQAFSDGGGQYYTCVGVPARHMTASYYGWVQTWGTCFLNRAGTESTTDKQRTYCFADDGSINNVAEWWGAASPTSPQLAGYCLAIGGTGAGWFYLMIDP